jgi:DNA-binding NarL/FixJ family response regulator
MGGFCMIRIVIAEDHHIVREGVRALLEKTGEIEVVGEARDGAEAVEIIKKLHPDVALLDISMPKYNGNFAIRMIKELGLPTIPIVLSMHSEPEIVRGTLKDGARAYLHKRSASRELIFAIHACLRNEIYLSPGISQILVEKYISEKEPEAEPPNRLLTDREVEVLHLIVAGLKSQEIANKLHIALKTAENHRANIMKKLGAANTAGLIKTAIKNGLVDL